MSRPSKPKKPQRTGSVTVRITPEQRALIEHARTRGMPPPAAAAVVPLDEALAQVDAPTAARFVEMLEGPPQLNDRLRKLIGTKAPQE